MYKAYKLHWLCGCSSDGQHSNDQRQVNQKLTWVLKCYMECNRGRNVYYQNLWVGGNMGSGSVVSGMNMLISHLVWSERNPQGICINRWLPKLFSMRIKQANSSLLFCQVEYRNGAANEPPPPFFSSFIHLSYSIVKCWTLISFLKKSVLRNVPLTSCLRGCKMSDLHQDNIQIT